MNERQANNKNKYSGSVFVLWLIALAVFLAGLAMALADPSKSDETGALAGTGEHSGTDLAGLSDAGRLVQNLDLGTADGGLAQDPLQAGLVADSGYVFRKLPPSGSVKNPTPAFDPKQEYVLIGAGLQGFYQTDSAASAWSVDLPEYAFEAQLVKRGSHPVPITENVRLEWELTPELKGEMQVTGDAVAFAAVIPAKALRESGFFEAAFATASEADKDAYNPYPTVLIRAFDRQSGVLLAESALDIGIAPGFGCAQCHADSQYGVLQIHDLRQDTDLEAQARAGETVQCRSCHSGLSLNQGKYAAGAWLGLSAAVHGWHAPYLAGQGEAACLSCHIGLGLPEDTAAAGQAFAEADLTEEQERVLLAEKQARQNERPRRLFMRDLHQERGLSCVRCHGILEEHAFALLKAEQAAGQPLAVGAIARIGIDRPDLAESKTAEEVTPRLPWVQQPDCESCHNFMEKPRLDTASAFNKWTDAPKEQSFSSPALFGARAENTGKLRCISCHGAPHAVYPAQNPLMAERDNLMPQQYQQDSRVLGGEGNCAVCHMQSMPFSIHHNIVQRSFTLLHMPEDTFLYMPKVRFSHSAHVYVDCMNCHHLGHEDGKTLHCTSSGCHDQSQPNPQVGGTDYRYFRNAFHSEGHKAGGNSCLSCHESRQKQGLPAGPASCKGCHRAPAAMWEEANQTN